MAFPVFDPAKLFLFAGQTGTLSNGNRTFHGYDHGSGVGYNAISDTPLGRPVGYVEFAQDWVADVRPAFGFVDETFNTSGFGGFPWDVIFDAGGASIVRNNGSYAAFPGPGILEDQIGGLIFHKATRKAWLVYPNGTIYPDTPSFGVDGSLLSGDGYDTGITGDDIFFAIRTNRGEGGTVNAGQEPAAIDLPGNVTIGWDAVESSGYAFSAAAGSFALTSSAATLRRSWVLATTSGSFIEGGAAASLKRGLRLPAAVGALTLAGTAPDLRAPRKIGVAAGPFAFTGSAAQFLKGRTLAASPVAFALTAAGASLKANRRLTAQAAVVAMGGAPAALEKGYRVLAGAAGFAVTGAQAAGLRGGRLSLGPMAFVLNGAQVTLSYSGQVAARLATVGTRASERGHRPQQTFSRRPWQVSTGRR